VTPADLRAWKGHIHGTAIYHHLADLMAADAALLRVLNRIEHTPKPNVLLAAVQYLLGSGNGPDLARFYPSLTAHPEPLHGIDGPFRSFVLENEEAIVELGHTRYTQTNECRRCVLLLPAVMMSGFDSFHLIDIGTSAGLNLAMDRYSYLWNDETWGEPSPVRLRTRLRGRLPALHDISILSRTGLDLNPVDPIDLDERRWLESLIWPEQHDRRERLRAALQLVAGVPIRFVAGDARVTLADVLALLPTGDPAVVINSFSFNQFDEQGRAAIEGIVASAREERETFRVSWELFTSPNEWANLRVDNGSGWREVGQGDPHGAWVEFYA
jgi:hypothetical protein